MNKKLQIFGIAALSVLTVGAGVLGVTSIVNASTPSEEISTVFQKVVDKLNLNVTSDQLKTAFEDSKQEVAVTNSDQELADAVTAGKITQAQADLAKKVRDWHMANKPAQPEMLDKSTLDNLTVAEARAKMDAARDAAQKVMEEQKAKMLSELNITETQLTELQTALRDAGVRMPFGGGKGGMMKGGDMGGRGGMMRGGMMNNGNSSNGASAELQ